MNSKNIGDTKAPVTTLETFEEEPAEIEQEFLQKLEENQLPTKYYRFLQKHNIQNSDQLLSEHYSEHKQRLVEEYIQDYKEPMLRSGGGFSVF